MGASLLGADSAAGGVDRAALATFTLVLLVVPMVGLLVRRLDLRPGAGDPQPGGTELADWALAGRAVGGLRTWFLLGGTIFTAYTFVAVPALVYGVGGLGYFAVPYTIVVFQLGYLVLPWLRDLADRHGWVTPADAVRGRYGSPALAAAVAVTGLLATMPYVALQLLGIATLLQVLGVPDRGPVADAAITATFAVLAVGTYRHGLRAPSLIAVVKGVLLFVVVGALSIAVLRDGGLGAVFDRAAGRFADRPGGSLLLPDGLAGAYVTLALGSAAALLLYPHVLTPVLAARDGDVLRRNCAGLLLWTGLLGLLALAGAVALGRGVEVPAGRAELAVPALLHTSMPGWGAGAALAAIGIGALVPAAVMSIGAAATFASNIYLEYVNPTALPGQVTQVARTVSVLVKVGALAFFLGLRSQDAITLQLLGGVWILQTLPAVLLGLRWSYLHRYALLVGLVTGLVTGTWLVSAQGFIAVTVITVHGHAVGIYAGVLALAVNLAVCLLLTPVLDRFRVSRGLGMGAVVRPAFGGEAMG